MMWHIRSGSLHNDEKSLSRTATPTKADDKNDDDYHRGGDDAEEEEEEEDDDDDGDDDDDDASDGEPSRKRRASRSRFVMTCHIRVWSLHN